MNTYITLLRCINVRGEKKINMAERKSMYDVLGYQNVQTYIQNGNVAFQTKEKDQKKLQDKIENKN